MKLVLNLSFVRKRLHGVQNDQNNVARSRSADDLPATAFAVLAALDNARKVQDLDLGTLEQIAHAQL